MRLFKRLYLTVALTRPLPATYYRRPLSTETKPEPNNESSGDTTTNNYFTSEEEEEFEQRQKKIEESKNFLELVRTESQQQEGKFVARVNYTEFIYAALKKLRDYDKLHDLATYKELLKVFPPGVYCPTNMAQRMGMFCAEQQLAAIEILHYMNKNKVYPDKEVEKIIIERFSKHSDVWRKCVRLNYWTAKMRNANPYPIPEEVPQQGIEIAKLAIARMCVDKQTVLSIMNTSRVPDSVDKTWIVSAQSPLQRKLIEELEKDKILYIEEGGRAWVQDKSIIYFVLKHENVTPKVDDRKRIHDFNSMSMQFFGRPTQDKVARINTMHDVEDGVILAICATGTSSQDSLLSWSRLLQTRNERLRDLKLLFRLRRPQTQVVANEQVS